MMQALFLSLTVKLFCVMGFFGTPALCISKPDIHYSDVHTAILQNSMKVLFGADEGRLPRDKNKRLLPDPDEPARPPRYMMELYERYRDGLLQKENFGNTVRSIHASVGEINGNAMFFFNLSAVKSSEKVLRAEVHLYKRKQQPWIQTGSRLEILLHEIGPNYISETGRVTLHRASRGWQWRDVTEAVLSCLATSRKPPHLFAINFKTQKSKNGKIRPVPLKKFSTHHSRPFLIIYSNETETVKLDQLDKLAERLKLFLPGHQSEQSHIDQLGKNITAMPASGSEMGFGKTRLWPQVETIGEAKNGSKKENNRKNRVSHSMTDVTDRQHLKINIKKAISIEEEERKSAEKESVTLMTVNENTRKDQKLGHVISESSVTSSSIDSNSGSNSKSSFNKSHFISKAHSRHPTGKHHHFAPKIRKTEAKVILVGTSSSLSDDPHAGSTNSTSFKRLKRSILTNEIPQDPVETKTVTKYNVLHTNPGVLQTRQQRAKNKKDSRLIPYPKESQNKKNRRKRKRPRRKNTRRRRLRFPKDWKSESDILSNQNAENEDHLCKRRKLHVNFDDIGWGEWIISPRWFNAHYCSGSCPFPLTKNLHPSNHATIQSIVHAIGIYPGVPAPSCVPDSVSSITLLYFDEDRNVVLKNYPGMTVLTCACR